MIPLLPFLSAAWIAASSGASHMVEVKVRHGQKSWTQTIKAAEGSQANFVGQAPGAGAPAQRMIFNALLAAGGRPGFFNMEYQAELSGGAGSQTNTIQAQGSLSLKPGARLAAVECGPWTLELGLDAAPGGEKTPPAWDAAGLNNIRLTMDVANGAARKRCRQVYRPETQGNVVDGSSRGGRKLGFIMNTLVTPEPSGGSFHLQYQVEHNPGTKPLQLQNEETLTLSRPKTLSGQGYRLDFLLERGAGGSDAKPAAPAPAKASPKLEEPKAVPLLR